MTEYQNEQVMNEVASEEPAVETATNEYEAPAPEKKDTKKLVMIAVAAIAVLAVILGILLLGAGGGKFVMEQQDFISDDDGNIYLDGKKIAQLDFDEMYRDMSLDGKSAIYECSNEGDEDSTLYVVTKKGATEIASGVSLQGVSLNNDYILYREDDMLVWYNVSKKKAQNLGEELDSAILSPDGKTVAYAEVEEIKKEEDGYEYTEKEYTTFVKKWSGKAVAIELKNATPSMVTDGGKTLYLSKMGDNGTDLYRSTNKKEPVKICANAYLANANLDRSEVIYYDREKDTYYWLNGKKDAVKIAKGRANVVIPTGTLAIETFKNQVFTYSDDSLGYFDGKEMHKIASDVTDVSINKDGKTLYFTKAEDDKNDLYYVKNTAAKKYEPAKVMEDVRDDVEISPDGKKAYVLTEDDELIVCNGKKKGKKIADDVSYLSVVNDKGVCFFEDEDGTFFASKNGKEKVNVADLSDDESGTRGLYGDYYYYEVEGELFYITGTKGVKAK